MKDALSYEDYISFRQEYFSKMDVISVGWESSGFFGLVWTRKLYHFNYTVYLLMIK